MKRKNILTILLVFILTTFSILGATPNNKNEKLAVPNINLKDQYGTEHNLKNYKGKVVFINFWATWCGYCIEELSHLEKISKDYKDDVIVLGIVAPKSKEAPRNPDIAKDKIIDFINRKNITFPILFDETGSILKEYSIRFFPVSFIVGKDGYLDGYIPGAADEANLQKFIEDALAK